MKSYMAYFIFLILFLLILTIASGLYIVQQQTNAIIETFGKFSNVAKPGLNIKIPFIQQVAGRVSLKIRQLDVAIETKTQDNVFVKMVVSVQYQVLADKVYESFYLLNNPEGQITSYIFDVVRARVPHLKLDEVFEKKDDVALAVKTELSEAMSEFGFGIIKTLVTDIDPNAKVKESMNEINAAERLREAAKEKGEADKIIKVKAAEAEAEAKALSGKGIADQRMAIVSGLRESVENFQNSIPGTSAMDVMNLILVTQYLDALKDLGTNSHTNTIMIPHSPGALGNITEEIRNAILTGNMISADMEDTLAKPHKKKPTTIS